MGGHCLYSGMSRAHLLPGSRVEKQPQKFLPSPRPASQGAEKPLGGFFFSEKPHPLWDGVEIWRAVQGEAPVAVCLLDSAAGALQGFKGAGNDLPRNIWLSIPWAACSEHSARARVVGRGGEVAAALPSLCCGDGGDPDPTTASSAHGRPFLQSVVLRLSLGVSFQLWVTGQAESWEHPHRCSKPPPHLFLWHPVRQMEGVPRIA